MTFEEEFEKFKLTAGASPKHKKIINHFKDWQPQQALQEVPQFVADWFDENKGDLEFGIYCENLNINNKPERELSTIEKFFNSETENKNPIETVIRMKDGYTVEKPQLFYLKNKITGKYLRSYTGLSMDDTTFRYEEVKDERVGGFGGGTTFTQQEIDSLETGSYEIIEVEE